MTLRKLKASEVAGVRENLRAEQGGRCALCQLPVPAEHAVLDHDHETGAVRATLHRGCNSLLGKVENNYKRYGVQNLASFLHGTAKYLQTHATNRTALIHPTHKSEEDKRLRRNLLARKRRALLKEP